MHQACMRFVQYLHHWFAPAYMVPPDMLPFCQKGTGWAGASPLYRRAFAVNDWISIARKMTRRV
jgi:hypothetical protein